MNCTDATAEIMLMLLADARLPTSGHTQSATLEAALTHGLSPSDIPAYCLSRLRTVVRVEAGTAVVGRHHSLSGRSLDAVSDAWAARTPSKAQRDASARLGRGYLRLARRLWPAAPPVQALTQVQPISRPVVLGAIAAATGLSSVQLARLVAYDDVQTVLAAGLKLAPSDPLHATGVLVSLADEVDAVAQGTATLTQPVDIPAASAPLVELWAQAHVSSPRRLFNA